MSGKCNTACVEVIPDIKKVNKFQFSTLCLSVYIVELKISIITFVV